MPISWKKKETHGHKFPRPMSGAAWLLKRPPNLSEPIRIHPARPSRQKMRVSSSGDVYAGLPQRLCQVGPVCRGSLNFPFPHQASDKQPSEPARRCEQARQKFRLGCHLPSTSVAKTSSPPTASGELFKKDLRAWNIASCSWHLKNTRMELRLRSTLSQAGWGSLKQ